MNYLVIAVVAALVAYFVNKDLPSVGSLKMEKQAGTFIVTFLVLVGIATLVRLE
jgi:hypothetical protein